MPASLRARLSRGTPSRPYDRRSPSPADFGSPLVHPQFLSPLSPSLACSPDGDTEGDTNPNMDADTPPDQPGLPTYAEYKRIEADYLLGLSPRKRDKALITQAMFDKIWDVLHQPDVCTIDTPQFRFWVRKMFTLTRTVTTSMTDLDIKDEGDPGDPENGSSTMTGKRNADPDASDDEADLELEREMGICRAASTNDFLTAVVLHENRPVAIQEQLYELFCYCHLRAGHGGRDKTCSVIRERYSWVPKELTAQFVKACPTCVLKRAGQGASGFGILGVDVGYGAKRAKGQRRQGKVEEPEVSLSPILSSSQANPEWPTTGGPLDPANPEPCGLRERKRKRDQYDENARINSGSSSPGSSVRASPTTRSIPRETPLESCHVSSPWSRAATSDGSLLPCNHPIDSPLICTTLLVQPFTVEHRKNSLNARTWSRNRNPTKTAELSRLASALSNESLDDNIDLTGLVSVSGGIESGSSDELLPPALRPLRLSGPIPSNAEDPPVSPSTGPFQIDPILLSFDYPGLGLSESPLNLGSPLGMDIALRSDTELLHRGRTPCGAATGTAGIGFFDRFHLPFESDVDLPGLDVDRSAALSLDSPDSSFASEYASVTHVLVGSPAVPELMSKCRSRYGYCDHGSLAMLLPCSTDADDAAQELDGFPFRS